jgi:uncharacterized protein
VLVKRPLRDWGFNLDHLQESLRYLKGFVRYSALFVGGGHVLLFLFSPPPQFPYPLMVENIAGNLLFKLLLSGTSEEPLFRGLRPGLGPAGCRLTRRSTGRT